MIDARKAPYYIKGDGKKDNAIGFKELQTFMSTTRQKHEVLLPGGLILSSFTRWTHKVRSFKVVGDNTTLKSIYSGTDEAQQRGLFAGEMMQTNVDTYKGTKEYLNLYPIETAKAGNSQITLKQSGLFIPIPGQKLFIRAGDLFAGGWPRACRNFDWIEAKEINGNAITLKMPLTEDYFDYDGAEIHILNNYCDHAEFEGITFEGNFAYPARKLILTHCNVTGWLWFSECQEIVVNNVYAEKVEFDKLVGSVICNGLRTPSSPSNGGSIYSIEMNDCTTGSIRLCPRYLTVNRPKIWANKVLINENPDKYDPWIPCIADAPARNPIRRYTINEPTYLSGAESQADKNLEFAPFEEIII